MLRILIEHKDPDIRRLLKDFLYNYVQEVQVYETDEFTSQSNDLKTPEIDLMLCDIQILESWQEIGKQTKYRIIALVEEKKSLSEKSFLSSNLRIIGQINIPEKRSLWQALIRQSNKFNSSSNKLPRTIMLSTIVGLHPVSPESIIAIEKNNRNLTVYTNKQILKEVKGTLTEILKYCSNDFIYINRHCALKPSAIIRLLPTTKEIFISVDNKEISFKGSRNKWKLLFSEVYNGDQTFWLGSIIQDFKGEYNI